jgi:hypothetical protein
MVLGVAGMGRITHGISFSVVVLGGSQVLWHRPGIPGTQEADRRIMVWGQPR